MPAYGDWRSPLHRTPYGRLSGWKRGGDGSCHRDEGTVVTICIVSVAGWGDTAERVRAVEELRELQRIQRRAHLEGDAAAMAAMFANDFVSVWLVAELADRSYATPASV